MLEVHPSLIQEFGLISATGLNTLQCLSNALTFIDQQYVLMNLLQGKC